MLFFPRFAAVIACCVPFLGCSSSFFLPRFDGGVLNPDLRFPRTAEIMEGVKCATVSYLDEHERDLLQQRIKNHENFYSKIEGTTYSPYSLRRPKGVPECGLDKHWATATRNNPAGCVANNCRREDINLGVSVWDYAGKSDAADAGCKPVPDYSPFALDSTQTATIGLTLTANNLGQINLTRIDALRLDPQQLFITPGGGTNGAAFPQFLASDRATTVLDVTAQMPQTVHGFIYAPLAIAKGRSTPLTLERVSAPFREKRRIKVASPASDDNASRMRGYTASDVATDSEIAAAKAAEKNIRDQLAKLPRDSAKYPALSYDLDQLDAILSAKTSQAIAQHAKTLSEIQTAIDRLEDIKDVKDVIAVLRRLPESSSDQTFVKAARALYAELETDIIIIDGKNNSIDEVYKAKDENYDGIVSKVEKRISNWAYEHTLAIVDFLKQIKPVSVTPEESIKLQAKIGEQSLSVRQLLLLMDSFSSRTITAQLNGELGRLEKVLLAAQDDRLPGFLPITEKIKKSSPPSTLTHNDYFASCGIGQSRMRLNGGAEIDYLGLKNMLNNFMKDQERMYRGLPEITLENLILTSQFVITIDMSAGMANPVFRLFPVLAPPTAQFKTDHTHVLKVTFRGNKQKKNPAKQKNLVESCRDRFNSQLEPDRDLCNTQFGVLLEQLIQNSQSSTGASQ
jgi:hypothetical protein